MAADAPIRIACFDLGGVVVRICRTWAEACQRAGLDIRGPQQLTEVELIQNRNALSDLYMSGKIECDEFFSRIALATGGLYSPDEVQRIHDVWVIEDEPGIVDLIDRLNATDSIITACLSNTNHAHWQALIQGETASPAILRLQRHLVSHEIGAVKPDDEIFHAAERILDARPEQIAFFDDLETNVAAAHRRGWLAHLIDHSQPTTPQLTDHLTALGVLPA